MTALRKGIRLLWIPLWILSGCATARPPTSEELTYWKKASVTIDRKLVFPQKDAADAWRRAKSFIDHFGDFKIRDTSGDDLIETVLPQNAVGVGYRVRRTSTKDAVHIEVECVNNGGTDSDMAERTHVYCAALRNYILTGEEPPSTLFQWNLDVNRLVGRAPPDDSEQP